MDISWNINHVPGKESSILTLGTFDGVHRGHQELIRHVLYRAKLNGKRSVVITFEPHPQLVLRSSSEPSLRVLTTIEEKIQYLQELNPDLLVVFPFSTAFAGTSPEDFINQVLIDKLSMTEIIIGHDHVFGRGRSGNLAVLQKLAEEKKFTLATVEPIYVHDQLVSSTRIRNELGNGNAETAAGMLGHPYRIQGRVVHGDGRGSDLGFPTINLKPYSQYKLIPLDGIYCSRFFLDKESFPAVSYIGTRPTFSLKEKVIETFVMDFDREIYHREVQIDLIKFIRADIKFATTDGLIEQINQDVNICRELFSHPAS